jgi:hypothetical protein
MPPTLGLKWRIGLLKSKARRRELFPLWRHVSRPAVAVWLRADPLVSNLPRWQDAKCPVTPDILVKGNLGAGQQRHIRLADRGESASEGVFEHRRHQLIIDLSRPACDMMQTIVAH